MDDFERVDVTLDIRYVAEAAGIAARDLHLIGEKFCDYIDRHGTDQGVYFATAYVQWLAETSVLLWERMLSVEIGPNSISSYYERGMEFVSLLHRLGLHEESLLLQDRWDAVLIKVQDSRNMWGVGELVELP